MASIATCTLGPADALSCRQQFGYAVEERWKFIAVAPPIIRRYRRPPTPRHLRPPKVPLRGTSVVVRGT
jgi:hypothetical protein